MSSHTFNSHQPDSFKSQSAATSRGGRRNGCFQKFALHLLSTWTARQIFTRFLCALGFAYVTSNPNHLYYIIFHCEEKWMCEEEIWCVVAESACHHSSHRGDGEIAPDKEQCWSTCFCTPWPQAAGKKKLPPCFRLALMTWESWTGHAGLRRCLHIHS